MYINDLPIINKNVNKDCPILSVKCYKMDSPSVNRPI